MLSSVRLSNSVSCSKALKSFCRIFFKSASLTTQLLTTFFSSFFSIKMFDVSIYFSYNLLAAIFFTVLTAVSFSLKSISTRLVFVYSSYSSFGFFVSFLGAFYLLVSFLPYFLSSFFFKFFNITTQIQ